MYAWLYTVSNIGICLYDDALKQKLLEIQDLEERAVYVLMDRINYPTQELVVVGNHNNNYPLYKANTEVGVYGVLVRLVTQMYIIYVTMQVLENG